MNKKGFTLAEILITLGIIGIIAAMVLPGIIENTKERQTVVKLKKSYSVIQNAVQKTIAGNGELDEWSDDSVEYFRQEMMKQLNIIRKCEKGYNCSKSFVYTYPAVQIADGTTIAFTTRSQNHQAGSGGVRCSASVKTRDRIQLHYNYCGKILIDLNGDGKPNRGGEDVFEFRVFTNGVLPNGIPNNNPGYSNVEAEDFNVCLRNKGGHVACTAWVIYKENLDYLHCPDKIGWDKVSSCKD